MLSVVERNQAVTEQKILQPLNQVLDEVTPKPTESKPFTVSQSTAQSIQDLFPEQEYEEKNIQLAKKSLGALSVEFSPEQLKNLITEVQFLTESWLDEFERQIFKGLTLQELLHEKGDK